MEESELKMEKSSRMTTGAEVLKLEKTTNWERVLKNMKLFQWYLDIRYSKVIKLRFETFFVETLCNKTVVLSTTLSFSWNRELELKLETCKCHFPFKLWNERGTVVSLTKQTVLMCWKRFKMRKVFQKFRHECRHKVVLHIISITNNKNITRLSRLFSVQKAEEEKDSTHKHSNSIGIVIRW